MSPKVKIAGTVVAGFPSPAEQYIEAPLSLDSLIIKRPAATFFVRVSGDSMIGEGIHDGDLLVVDRSVSPADGDVVVASVDGDFTVKKYRKGRRDDSPEIRVWLQAANPAFPDIVMKPGQELDYLGKVIAFVHSYVGHQ